MQLFDHHTYQERRKHLLQSIDSGIILLMGNEESPMNCADNVYPFRQDSSFLYYCGINKPHFTAIIDVDEGHTTLFGDDFSVELVVWMGPQPTVAALAEKVGISKTAPYAALHEHLTKAKSAGRAIHYLPPYRAATTVKLHQWLDIPLQSVKAGASTELIKAIVAQRSIKTEAEIVEMVKALNVTRAMHVAAMKNTKPGIQEAELAGIVEGLAVSGGGHLAYPVIMTINGQTLHNHYHGNTLQEGQLVLGDFGADTAMRYAGDITRTWPVSRTFTSKQRDIYNLVLKAELKSIAALKPGIPYRDVHIFASTIIAEG
jgi:Xaa-Pro aminopeptidase